MNRLELLGRRRGDAGGISESRYAFDDWLNQISNPLLGLTMTMGAEKAEAIEHSFEGYVRGALMANGPVFAAELARVAVFSEARFRYRRIINGRPGELFGDQSLRRIERPWPGGTTGDLLSRMLLDADFAGSGYVVDWDNELVRLRPDKVGVVLEPRPGPGGGQMGWRSLGIIYRESPKDEPVVFLPGEYCQFAPSPDPLATYRGMSWLTPIIREIQADGAATKHRLRFLENMGTPNLAVKLPKEIRGADFKAWVAKFKAGHDGPENAGRTVYLGAGADVTVVGKDLKELDFKITQGAGETRIAAASGTGAIIAQLSEGMQGAALNAGNYGAARRRFGDITIRPLWRNVAGSLETIVRPPVGAELWYDAADVAFLRDDQNVEAETREKNSNAINSLVMGGFDADAVIDAVTSGDLARLKGKHNGLPSVQQQPNAA